MTVSLVSMPFKALQHPPIQLGILQQSLLAAGIDTQCHSMELLFMEHLAAAGITFDEYQDVAQNHFPVLLGDWIFRVPPYMPAYDGAGTDDAYLDHVRGAGTSEEAVQLAMRMKAVVPDFLAAAAHEILASRPRVVGFSTVFQQNVASLVLAKMLAAADPELTIVFGGDNCDGVMGAALHASFPWIDFVVRGEGERVLVALVEDLLAGRAVRPQPGLCFREGERVVAIPPADRPELAMHEVPSPRYDEYFERLAASPVRAELAPSVSILFESSRGCWWGAKSHCTFCGLNAATMPFRSKPAARVAEEILELARRYRVLRFVAVDDIIDLRHIRELLPLLRDSGCDLDIYYETKANLTKEQLRAFRAAGVRAVQPGIESLSTPILRAMRKGVTALQNIRLLKWCAETGVAPDWNLLWGFPGEAPEEYARMAGLIPSLVHLPPPACSPVRIQRFSPYFESPQEFGLELAGPRLHYRFLYPEDAALADIAYDYEFRYLDGRNARSYARQVEEAVAAWRAAHPAGAGSLVMRRGPGFLLIEDRRPGLEQADYQLDETEARLYLACDGGATAASLHALLAGEDENAPAVEEIEEFLDGLVASRLMYREDDRFLALALAAAESSAIDRHIPATVPAMSAMQ